MSEKTLKRGNTSVLIDASDKGTGWRQGTSISMLLEGRAIDGSELRWRIDPLPRDCLTIHYFFLCPVGHVCIYDVEHDSKEYSRIKFEGLQTEFTEEVGRVEKPKTTSRRRAEALN